MDELTDVQRDRERRLERLLSDLGLSLVDREVGGASESYITARIGGTPLTVFIYEDGEAQLLGGGEEYRLELGDYAGGGAGALWSDFEICLRQEVARLGRASP